MVSTIGIPKLYLILAVAGGLSIILTIGLSSGLAARPNNCKERTTLTPPLTTSTGTSRTTSGTTQSSSSSPSSSSSRSTTTTTTTTTVSSSSSSSSPSTTRTTITATTPFTTTTSQSSTTSPVTTTTTTASTTSVTSATRTTPATTTISTTTGTTTPPPTLEDILLPANYDVENYDLLIKSYFVPVAASGVDTANEEYFRGTVKITFKHTVASNTITLHVHETMNITSVRLLNKVAGTTASSIQNQRRLPYQKYELVFQTNIPIGDYILELSYAGDYGFKRGSLAGFYLSKYREDGQLKTVGATQFEPTDARRAFPCFDEPSLKATFDVTIQHPVGSKALSNWPDLGTTDTVDENNKPVKQTKYQQTLRMSTYLAAWAIVPNDYIFVTSTSAKGVPIRIHSRKSAAGLLDFAAQAAKGALDFFENTYFGISEAVPPKIDMITIPQFSAGAMENWGLVTYRETALLYSDASNSLLNKQSVASIIAHELAHFWFGNLVTCSWWSDLWLNEAMASFLQVKAVEAVYPEFGIGDQFITSSLIPVMYDDGFYSTHPVYTEVISPDQINSIFDSITYDKGNALLRMLESTVTPANFQAGLKTYITENKFGSGKAEDFYNDLTAPKEMSDKGVTISQYMDNWLNSITYPWINVFLQDISDSSTAQPVTDSASTSNAGPTSDSGSTNNAGSTSESTLDSTSNAGRIFESRSVTKVLFEQDRFYFSDYDYEIDEGAEPDREFLWKVFLRCKAGGTRSSTAANPDLDGTIDEFEVYFETRLTEITLMRDYTWVKCNTDFKGYYVVEYEEAVYDKLGDALLAAPTAFSSADQADLLHSVWTLAYADYVSYGQVARLSRFLSANDISYVPWRTFSYHVSKIATLLEHRPSFYGLSKYAIEVVKEGVQQWTDKDLWNDQGDHLLRLSKINAADTLGRMQDYSVLVKASELFNTIPVSYFSSPNNVTNPLSPNLRSIVYKYHIQNTYDYFDWYKMVELYEMTSDPQERSAALLSLSFVRSTPTLAELLSNTMNGFVSGQDLFTVLANIGRNPTGRGNAWNFMRSNWNFFYERYGSSRGSGQAVRAICESFDNELLAESIRDFYIYKPVGADRSLRVQTLYIVEWNRFWVRFIEENLIDNLFGPLQ